ncbi:hypothetical protein EV130_10421 [Rhizobium azibense]|uniref:Uncharacterized protein n=1 Tax=Rhizobium azibense TaxID=1136135 RepID=A0A4V2VBW1_9HYPH|nr:hypothetical protein [Rhizobium azibense]TCU26415.1 hypothetical protein EV130_10421 [Rhizobium azibense]
MMHRGKRLPFIETYPDQESPSAVQAALAKASTAPRSVIDAIEHFSSMPVIDVGVGHRAKLDNWHDLYKAYEALGKVSGLAKYGIQRSQAERIRNQAQHFRQNKTTAPYAGMSLDEAKALIILGLKKRSLLGALGPIHSHSGRRIAVPACRSLGLLAKSPGSASVPSPGSRLPLCLPKHAPPHYPSDMATKFLYMDEQY